MTTITERKSEVSETQSLCSGVAVRGLCRGSQDGDGGRGWGKTGGGTEGWREVGVAERGVWTVSGGANFLFTPLLLLLLRCFSGEEALRDLEERDFSGEQEERDLEVESLLE